FQIKNRDNSENSSNSAIRNGTEIKKWFRSFSRTGATNWSKLPVEMSQYGLSEEGFMEFVAMYLKNEKPRQ
ncbi:MAG: SinI family restriction endonuclease, partial [Candidatus Fonsibacter sp.]